MNVRRLLIAAVVVMQPVIAHAQWINQRSPNTPRLPDGTPNLAAPVPRAIDGKPDLSGVWEVVGDRVMEIEFTFDDPKTFTRPWSATVKFNLLSDTDLLEFHCDNEKWAEKSR